MKLNSVMNELAKVKNSNNASSPCNQIKNTSSKNLHLSQGARRWHCSMDVVGLYPHISHLEGLNCMKEIIEEFMSKSELNNMRISVEDLVDLAKFILEKIFLEFDDKIYRQILGTAIGTTFTPSFANMFMSKLEGRMLKGCRLAPWV